MSADFATMAARMNGKTVDEQRREIVRLRGTLAALVRTATEVHRISHRTHDAWTALAAALDDARAVMTQPAETAANKSAVDLARLFWDTYERLAPSHFGIAHPQGLAFDPDSREGYLITAVFAELLANGTAEAAAPRVENYWAGCRITHDESGWHVHHPNPRVTDAWHFELGEFEAFMNTVRDTCVPESAAKSTTQPGPPK